MTRKKKPKPEPDPNRLDVTRRKDQSDAEALADAALRPSFQATATLREYGKSFGDLSLNGLFTALQEQIGATGEGDLGRGEAMLTAQAHTLDAIFNNLARRAINAVYMNNLDIYLKLALRAQSQCRATWETLATMKNPPIAGYVGQANIAHGHQQVNNAARSSSTTLRAREDQNQKNELLEEQDVERLDTGAKGAAGKVDPAMAPVGEVDRSEDT